VTGGAYGDSESFHIMSAIAKSSSEFQAFDLLENTSAIFNVEAPPLGLILGLENPRYSRVFFDGKKIAGMEMITKEVTFGPELIAVKEELLNKLKKKRQDVTEKREMLERAMKETPKDNAFANWMKLQAYNREKALDENCVFTILPADQHEHLMKRAVEVALVDTPDMNSDDTEFVIQFFHQWKEMETLCEHMDFLIKAEREIHERQAGYLKSREELVTVGEYVIENFLNEDTSRREEFEKQWLKECERSGIVFDHDAREFLFSRPQSGTNPLSVLDETFAPHEDPSHVKLSSLRKLNRATIERMYLKMKDANDRQDSAMQAVKELIAELEL